MERIEGGGRKYGRNRRKRTMYGGNRRRREEVWRAFGRGGRKEV